MLLCGTSFAERADPDRYHLPCTGRTTVTDRPQIEAELARRRGTVSTEDGKTGSSSAAHFVEQYAAAKGAQAGQQLDPEAATKTATVDFFGRAISVPKPAQADDATVEGKLVHILEDLRRSFRALCSL